MPKCKHKQHRLLHDYVTRPMSGTRMYALFHNDCDNITAFLIGTYTVNWKNLE